MEPEMIALPESPRYISIVIPVFNGETTLGRCLEAVFSSKYPNLECIVVDDGSNDKSREIAAEYPVKILKLPNGPFGPAYARNRGAEIARGDLLFFIDSDVIIHPDVLYKINKGFEENSEITALFGSYDESPDNGEFLSQYKNLLHHYVHQRGKEEASTFWSGCGAIRRDIFLKLGGFNEKRYKRPSIEDIELGYQLRAAGYKILLKKDIQVKHLKRWSLIGLLKTDIRDRAVPWTLLILRDRNLPNDLNLQFSQRLSTILLFLIVLHLAIFSYFNHALILPLLIGLFLSIACNWHWKDSSPNFHMNQQAEQLAFAFIAIICLLALYHNLSILTVPFIFLLPLLLAANYLSKSGKTTRQFVYWSTIVIILLDFFLLFTTLPIQVVVPQLLMTLIIVLLNLNLYVFFAKKRGIIFALASYPFQLLYYFYSLVAFVIGGGIHFWNMSIKSKQEYRYGTTHKH